MVQDVLGEPASWANVISDQLSGLPEMREATIEDIFVARNKITLYARAADGTQTAAVFEIDNQDLRHKVVMAIRPGVPVLAALHTPI